jgi:hypothetical protein
MAVETYRVAVFFITGLVSGLMLSFFASNGFVAPAYRPVRIDSDPGGGGGRITGIANASDAAEYRRRYPTKHEHMDDQHVPEKPLEFGDEMYHNHGNVLIIYKSCKINSMIYRPIYIDLLS